MAPQYAAPDPAIVLATLAATVSKASFAASDSAAAQATGDLSRQIASAVETASASLADHACETGTQVRDGASTPQSGPTGLTESQMVACILGPVLVILVLGSMVGVVSHRLRERRRQDQAARATQSSSTSVKTGIYELYGDEKWASKLPLPPSRHELDGSPRYELPAGRAQSVVQQANSETNSRALSPQKDQDSRRSSTTICEEKSPTTTGPHSTSATLAAPGTEPPALKPG